jgi:hypothetical protein
LYQFDASRLPFIQEFIGNIRLPKEHKEELRSVCPSAGIVSMMELWRKMCDTLNTYMG